MRFAGWIVLPLAIDQKTVLISPGWERYRDFPNTGFLARKSQGLLLPSGKISRQNNGFGLGSVQSEFDLLLNLLCHN
jgi:hypothetical protein